MSDVEDDILIEEQSHVVYDEDRADGDVPENQALLHNAPSPFPQQIGKSREAEPFTTIDWMRDINKDRTRRIRLKTEKKKTWKGFFIYIFDASQSWILVALIAILTGLFAGFIDIGVEWIGDLKGGICLPEFWLSNALCCRGLDPCEHWHTWSSFIPNIDNTGAFFFNFAIYFVAGTLFASTCAYLVKIYAPFAAGSGIPEIKTILGGFVVTKFLGAWTLMLKSLGLILSVASGLNLGKEGPLVHVACCIGNILSRIFEKFRLNEVKKREVLSASCAAGVSCAFGAPIGGVLFSLEEVSSYFPHKTLWRSFFCAVVAALTLQLLNPFHTGKLVLFQVSFHNSWYWFELLPFVVLGCLGGVIGVLFIRLNTKMCALRKSTRLSQYPITEVAVVAAITALASYGSDFLRIDSGMLIGKLFSECDGSSPDALGICAPDLAGRTILGLFVACLVKLLLTIFTFGLRVPCGLFIPSLAVGACLGRAVGIAMQLLEQSHNDWGIFGECLTVTHCITPGIYALVGAASVLGGVTRMTVSLVVIMFELTGGVNLILPLMIAVMFSKWIGDALNKAGMYDEQIQLNGYPFLEGGDSTDTSEARHVMRSNDLATMTLHGNTIATLETLMTQYHYQGFPVVTSRQDNVVVGFVSRHELASVLNEKRRSATYPPTTKCFFTRDMPFATAGGYLDLRECLDETPVQVVETTSVAQICHMFKQLGLRYCLVVRQGRLVGFISKKDLLRHRRKRLDPHMISRNYSQQVLEESDDNSL